MDYLQPESPRQARRRPIGAGEFGLGSTYSDGLDAPMEAWERDQLLEGLDNVSGQTSSGLFTALDYPASLLRGVLAGKDFGQQASESELLDVWGLRPSKEALGGFGRPLAEFAVGAGIDPLNLLTFGGSTLTKAGRVAKGAGLLDDASRVASRALINSGDELSSFGKAASKSWLDNFDKKLSDLTDSDLAARPLVGTRAARKSTTLQDLIDAADNPIDAERSVRDAAGWLGVNRGQALGRDIGWHLPFSSIGVSTNVPILGSLANGAFDRIGQAVRWSAPGRYLHGVFDSSVSGATDETGQIIAKQVNRARELGEQEGRRRASDILQKLPQESFTPDNQQLLRRVLAGPQVADASDISQVASSPGMQAVVDDWRAAAPDYIRRSRDAGVSSAELTDPYGAMYFPRHANKNQFPEMVSTGGGGQRDFSVITGDQLARSESLKIPGGEATIQKLSLDPNVAGHARTAATDEEAARYIHKYANDLIAARMPGAPEYTMDQALGAARLFHRIDPSAIRQGFPLFGASVGEDIVRYMTGREKSIRVANTLYDIMASSAKLGSPMSQDTRLPGGAYRSFVGAQEAFDRLGLRTVRDPATKTDFGAASQLLDRLEARFGAGAVSDIKNVSIDERLFDRLTKIADFYERPETSSLFLKTVDNITKLFKGSILAWPARFVRDWYSAVISNFIEIKNPSHLMSGYAGAKFLVQGQYDRLESVLRRIPRYRALSAAERKRLFLSDMAASQVLTGRGLADVADELASDASGAGVISELIPGSSPRTTAMMQLTDALKGRKPIGSNKATYSELLPLLNPAAIPSRVGRLAESIRHPLKVLDEKQVKNPILRWSNKTGDLTDAINRVAGYIGLLRQGLDPMEAARRIKASQVDYQSLTKVEREFLRRIFPWYAYTSRILKYVAKELWENPGGMYQQFALRAPEKLQESDSSEYIPQRLKENFAINLDRARNLPVVGSLVDLLSPGGTTDTYLHDFDIPGIDPINKGSIKRDPVTGSILPWASLKSTGLNLLGDMTPLIKGPLQMLLGTDVVTKRDLRSQVTTPQMLLRKAGIPEGSDVDLLANQISPLLDIIPFYPRGSQTVRRLMDDRNVPDFATRRNQTIFNTFTGGKVQPVTDEARTLDARRTLEDVLQPYSRSFEQRYIPEEFLPNLPPEIQRLYTLDRSLNREQRLREKARKAANANPMGLNPLTLY